MKRLSLYLCVLLLCPAVSFSELVDTGTPTGFSPSIVGETQYLAARFELTQPAVITRMQGFFDTSYNNFTGFVDGTLTAVLYGDDGVDPDFGGRLPNTANEIFSAPFTVQYTERLVDDSFFEYTDWFGVEGLHLPLAPQAYWLAFEYRPGNTLFYSAMPDAPPAPLDGAWANDIDGYLYHNNPDLPVQIGVRIDGGVVPLPSSVVLVVLGLLTAQRKCRQSARQEKRAASDPEPSTIS